MRVVVIGDVHGNPKWKNAVYKRDINTGEIVHCLLDTTTDKVVFIGDYVDAFGYTNAEILHNLKEIIQFKKDHKDDVVLLWGNHDVAYYNGDRNITGHRLEMEPELYQLFYENRNLFQLAYQVNDVIFTHGGIHRGWYKLYVQPVIDGKIVTRFTEFLEDCKNIADYLNIMFEFNYEPIFMIGRQRGGCNNEGGPLWADKVEIYTKPLPNYHQIVGHTKVPNVKTYDLKDAKVTFVDCLPVSDEFFKIDL